MGEVFVETASEYGIFAGLFIVTLFVFANYVNKHHKEIVKMNNGLGKRLNEVEKYVRNTLVEQLADTRAILSHSTTINEIALRELKRKLPESSYEMTDSQVIAKFKMDKISDETQVLKKRDFDV